MRGAGDDASRRAFLAYSASAGRVRMRGAARGRAVPLRRRTGPRAYCPDSSGRMERAGRPERPGAGFMVVLRVSGFGMWGEGACGDGAPLGCEGRGMPGDGADGAAGCGLAWAAGLAA